MKYATVLPTALLAALAIAAPANAAIIESASATITAKPVAGGNFEYDLTLTNTGTTNLGTFWFAWIPGQDYLSVRPLSETTPTGWNLDDISNSGSSDGFALQWVASTLLAPNTSISGFSFTTSESPASVEGTSAVPAYAGIHTSTAVVYAGQPLVGTGFTLIATAVPEPTSLTLLTLSAIPLLSRRRQRA